MDIKKIALSIGAVFSLIAYIFISSAIKTDPAIWYLTRIFGLIALALLSITVILGELRLLHIIKADFALFRFHVPIAITSMFVVLLHGISAVADHYKWGKSLVLVQYLGFSFSDHWLIYLSLGTLAFYVMIIIGLTSMQGVIQKLGYKLWKFVHYFSYVAFYFAFFHSIQLGTDVKNNFFAMLTIFFIMIIITAFLIVRIIKQFNIFEVQSEIAVLCIIIAILLVVTLSIFAILQYQHMMILAQGNRIALLQNISDTQRIIIGGTP